MLKPYKATFCFSGIHGSFMTGEVKYMDEKAAAEYVVLGWLKPAADSEIENATNPETLAIETAEGEANTTARRRKVK